MRAKRFMPSIAAAFFIASAFALAGAEQASSPPATSPPVTPPGPQQVITPPLPIPTPAPAVTPTPDTLELPAFEIVATIDGAVVGEPVIALPEHAMLKLDVAGSAAAEVDGKTRAVTWSLNCETTSIDLTYAGHHATFTGPPASVWLFTASINNPDPFAAPLVAQRWCVVAGRKLDPAPGPGPTTPVDPSVPPVVSPEGFRVLFLEDSDRRSVDLSNLLADPSLREYLNTHAVKGADGKTPDWRIVDTSSLDANKLSPQLRELLKPASATARPWMVAANATTFVSIELPTTPEAILAALKPIGGP